MGLQNPEEASDTDTEGVTISSRVSGTRQRSWGTEQRASWVRLRGFRLHCKCRRTAVESFKYVSDSAKAFQSSL